MPRSGRHQTKREPASGVVVKLDRRKQPTEPSPISDNLLMIFTVGIWIAKPGHEDAFVSGWNAMADWTLSRFPQAHGTLLRDRAAPNRFLSFGPWPDEQTVAAWRADPAFNDHVGRMREHLADFQPGTFDMVSKAHR
jgi:heme-degrading monooxygenase HmoA